MQLSGLRGFRAFEPKSGVLVVTKPRNLDVFRRYWGIPSLLAQTRKNIGELGEAAGSFGEEFDFRSPQSGKPGSHRLFLVKGNGKHFLVKRPWDNVNPERDASFIQALKELSNAATWNAAHPRHGVKPVGLVKAGGKLFLVYNFQPGCLNGSFYMHSLSTSQPGFAKPRRLALSAALGEVTGKAHLIGMGHGDFAPNNVLVEPDADFFPKNLRVVDWQFSNKGVRWRGWSRANPRQGESRNLLSDLLRLRGVVRPDSEEVLAFSEQYDLVTGRKLADALKRGKRLGLDLP